MKELTENFGLFIEKLTALIQSYDIIIDTLDIALVAFLIFNAIKMLRQTRGIQIVKGLVLVGVVFAVISLLHMQASTYLFKTLLSDFILVLIILFTPEIRHALESMGRSKLGFFNFFGAQQGDELYERKKRAILEICKACNDMSKEKTGALIVFERDTQLGDIIKTGTTVDAKVSKELIGSLFFTNSPLHDGAVVIRDGRVHAAGCILPLTENNRLSSELGTRHRASLGITENSDAVVVVVSEETGKISISYEGRMERDISDGVLIERLFGFLLPNKNDMVKKTLPALIKSKIKERRNK